MNTPMGACVMRVIPVESAIPADGISTTGAPSTMRTTKAT